MKKIKSLALLSLVSIAMSACQGNLADVSLSDINSQSVSANAVLNPLEIKELKNTNAVIGDANSAVIVATLTGGSLEKPAKQKMLFDFAGTKNIESLANTEAVSSEVNFGENEIVSFSDKRHHKNINSFLKEKEEVEKAYRQGKVVQSNGATINALLREGATRTFNVLVGDDGKYEKRKAVLHKISKTAYFWVDKSVEASLDKNSIAKSIKYWEEKAFPIVTSKFGPAPMPPNDVDGEVRINLFLTPLDTGLYGYFYSADVLSEGSPESNKADMLYINSDIFKQGQAKEDDANGTLIHEFQHLINFNSKVTLRLNKKKEPLYEDRWLDEGMSTYAEQLGGYGLPSGDTFSAQYLSTFFKDPSAVQIVTNGGNINYGTSLLFVLYMAEQYGPDVVKKLTASDKVGIENIEYVTKKPFNKVFSDWATALLLSGSKKNAKFDFKSVNLHKKYGDIVLDGINLENIVNKFPKKANFSMYNWTVNYLKLDNLSNTQVNLNIKNSGKATITANLVKLK